MRSLYSKLYPLLVLLCAAAFFVFSGCTSGDSCESDESCGAGKVCDTTTKLCKPKAPEGSQEAGNEKTGVDGGPDSAPKDDTSKDDTSKDGDNPDKGSGLCPPGCSRCGSSGSTELKKDAPLGSVCEEKCGVSNCAKGLSCITNGALNQGYCWKGCSKDSDCTGGQKCVSSDANNDKAPKFCASVGKATETCNYTKQQVCGDKLTCLVDDENTTSGKCVPCKDCAVGSSNRRQQLGALCKELDSSISDCADGLVCIANGIENRAYCYKPCKADSDCSQGGLKCIKSAVTKDISVCAIYTDDREECNYSEQKFCGAGLSCLVSDSARTAGTCYKTCKVPADCLGENGKDLGRECRKISSSSNNTYCLDKVDFGPKCLNEACSASATATNCQKGLSCFDGYCLKTCTKSTEKTDCQAGETCELPSLTSPFALCQAKGTQGEGDDCNASQRCDESKSLKCVRYSDTVAKCTKVCDETKGEDNNPACGPDYKCTKPNLPYAICQKKAATGQPCNDGSTCGGKLGICIRFGGGDAFCLDLCKNSENFCKDGEDGLNPGCDGGKGTCIKLSGSINRDGQNYDGACLPFREKKLKSGEVCDTDPKRGGLKAPDCEKGTRCVGLGGKPVCYVDCEPCDGKKDANGKWVHPNCEGGKAACNALRYSDGRPAGGVCPAQGDKVIPEGDICGDDPKKTCVESATCVRFSNADGAKSVCSRNCDPDKGANGNPDCGGGRCGRLTSGGGVCVPQPRRRRKLGETCLRDIGQDGFNDCVSKEDGKPLICALASISGLDRVCQVRCDATKGSSKNPDCEALGLKNHICVPASTRDPSEGACLEKCTFTDRLRCKTSTCVTGVCRTTKLGRELCKDAAGKKQCTDTGGTCDGNDCQIGLCN